MEHRAGDGQALLHPLREIYHGLIFPSPQAKVAELSSAHILRRGNVIQTCNVEKVLHCREILKEGRTLGNVAECHPRVQTIHVDLSTVLRLDAHDEFDKC